MWATCTNWKEYIFRDTERIQRKIKANFNKIVWVKGWIIH